MSACFFRGIHNIFGFPNQKTFGATADCFLGKIGGMKGATSKLTLLTDYSSTTAGSEFLGGTFVLVLDNIRTARAGRTHGVRCAPLWFIEIMCLCTGATKKRSVG